MKFLYRYSLDRKCIDFFPLLVLIMQRCHVLDCLPDHFKDFVGSGIGETSSFNTLRPRQGGRHFPDGIFKWIFLNENVWIAIKISLKFVPRGPISNIPALVQITAWRRPGDKPLSEPMMVSLLTHICFARPQWVNAWVVPWVQAIKHR